MNIGCLVRFEGYTDPPTDSSPTLTVGDLAVIIANEGEDAWRVARVTSAGEQPVTELVFTEEISQVRVLA